MILVNFIVTLNGCDGKDAYLKDIPLVLQYAITTANRYIELKPLARILESTRIT